MTEIEKPGMGALMRALASHGLPEEMAWNLSHFIDTLNAGTPLEEMLEGPSGPSLWPYYRALRLIFNEGDPGEYDADFVPDSPVTQEEEVLEHAPIGEDEKEEEAEAEEEPSPHPDDLVVTGNEAPDAPVPADALGEEEEEDADAEDMAEEDEEDEEEEDEEDGDD